MSEGITPTTLVENEGVDPDRADSHNLQLAEEFTAVVGDGLNIEDTTAEIDRAKTSGKMFGAELMSTLLEDPTTTRNFSMTRNGGAWSENS